MTFVRVHVCHSLRAESGLIFYRVLIYLKSKFRHCISLHFLNKEIIYYDTQIENRCRKFNLGN